MNSNRPPDKAMQAFKGHLTRRHRQNHAHRQRHPNAPPPADGRAEQFGRYLRAARLNANLPVEALARRAKLPPDTIRALEHGLILGDDIRNDWLARLARALNEDPADFALLLGRRPPRRWNRPALNLRWPVLALPRATLAPLMAALAAVFISVAMLARTGLPFSPAADVLVDITPESVAPQLAPAYALTSSYDHLNPADRPSLLKAERLKIAPAAPSPPAVSLPPVVETNRVTSRFLNSLLPASPAEPKPRIQIFFDIVYWLTVGPSLQLEGRPSVITAESRLENQIWVQPKIININADERLNLVKAEIKL